MACILGYKQATQGMKITVFVVLFYKIKKADSARSKTSKEGDKNG